MKHLEEYIYEKMDEPIDEANIGQMVATAADFAKKAKDWVSNAFKKIKGWLSNDKTTKKETKEVIAREKDLSKELAEAVSRVMKKSGLERSDKKKKDDDIADDYDKLHALVIQMAEFLAKNKPSDIVTALLEDLKMDLTDLYTTILNDGVAAIQEYDEQAKTYFLSEEGMQKITVIIAFYKYSDSVDYDMERRHEIYSAQGLFK